MGEIQEHIDMQVRDGYFYVDENEYYNDTNITELEESLGDDVVHELKNIGTEIINDERYIAELESEKEDLQAELEEYLNNYIPFERNRNERYAKDIRGDINKTKTKIKRAQREKDKDINKFYKIVEKNNLYDYEAKIVAEIINII